ncbi:DUF1150 family protein [Roseovarius sp. E0-M6]|uniref:DUF1150 family protein n=1 Tax=Roseovarius sp. E0-M6 TaxID=3127118 RepID=UPI003010436C
MNTPFDFDTNDESRIAYVRPVEVSELPQEVQDQLPDDKVIYAVHSAEGERLALVRERGMAFVLARQNDLEPVTVH